MLVSSIARFNAVNMMNNTSFASMQVSNSLNKHAFGGEHDLSMLNKIDNKMSLDLASNNLLYKIAYFQEKMAEKHQKLNILA
jgi:hypothetical protein